MRLPVAPPIGQDSEIPVTTDTLTWIEQDTSLGAAEDLAYSTTLLRAVQHETLTGPLVRLYRPIATMSFGQQDVRLAGYQAARAASNHHNFVPVVRKVGGRAAAYHEDSLVIDHIQPEADAIFGFKQRFEYFGELFTTVLRRLGVPAGVGEIPGEYCAGEYSVHAVLKPTHRIKLAGTAQRVVKGAWLFSTSLVVENGTAIRNVLTDVYDHLGLDFLPETAGAVEDGAPGVTVEDVIDELQLEYERQFLTAGVTSDQASYRLESISWAELQQRVPAV